MYLYSDIKLALESEDQKRFIRKLLASGVARETVVSALPVATCSGILGISTESFTVSNHTNDVISNILSFNGVTIAQEGLLDKIKSFFGSKPKAQAYPKKMYDELFSLFPSLIKALEDAQSLPFPDYKNTKAVKAALEKISEQADLMNKQDSPTSKVYNIEKAHAKVSIEDSGWTKESAEKAKADLASIHTKITALAETLEPKISKAWTIVDSDSSDDLDDDVYHFFRTYAEDAVGEVLWWTMDAYKHCADSAEFGLTSEK